jgi:hypothetical protein
LAIDYLLSSEGNKIEPLNIVKLISYEVIKLKSEGVPLLELRHNLVNMIQSIEDVVSAEISKCKS